MLCLTCLDLLKIVSSSIHFLSGGAGDDQMSKGYDYLLSMKLWSLTLERVKSLENELEAKTQEMARLKVRLRSL